MSSTTSTWPLLCVCVAAGVGDRTSIRQDHPTEHEFSGAEKLCYHCHKAQEHIDQVLGSRCWWHVLYHIAKNVSLIESTIREIIKAWIHERIE